MTRSNAILLSGALALAAVSGAAGYWLAGRPGGTGPHAASERKILYWYDPMVPNERYPGPGKSSMGMDLVPKYADEGAGAGVTVSPAMAQNLGIRVARAETRDIAPVVRAVGQVAFDERLLYQVQTLTPGFVESLSVRAEGEPVAAGKAIAEVYSPELLTAQNEYRALLSAGSVASARLRQAARSRLRLLGASEGLIRRLERGGAPQRTYAVVARAPGIVTQIGARPGAQVALGQSIVTVQGLGRMLVIAEVPEGALAGVHRGQPAEIGLAAFPGEVRRGAVDYVFPSLDAQSRTARVRITLSNPDGRLKAGMFATVTLQGTGGMALVVPSEAVIDTGRRRVVIVRRNGAFVPAEVTTGRDAGDYTQILGGLRPGEEVVVSGQFLIDSEASLSGVIARLRANPPPAAAAVAASRGVVEAVDPAGGLITIRHEPIPELGWPAMAMTFRVAQPGMLRGMRRGAHVAFTVDVQPEGGRHVVRTLRIAG